MKIFTTQNDIFFRLKNRFLSFRHKKDVYGFFIIFS